MKKSIKYSIAFCALLPIIAMGADTWWNAGTVGDWADAGNWGAGVPTASLRAIINNAADQVTVSTAGAVANDMILKGSLTVASTGNLTAGALTTTTSASATTIVVDGQLTHGGGSWFQLGGAGGSTLTINSGGSVTSSGSEFLIGQSGNASLIVDGTFNRAGWLHLKNTANITVNSGGLLDIGVVYTPSGDTAGLTFNGGVSTIGTLEWDNGGTGTLDMNGGQLIISSLLDTPANTYNIGDGELIFAGADLGTVNTIVSGANWNFAESKLVYDNGDGSITVTSGPLPPNFFLGEPPLGPSDTLRQALLPYDMTKLNCLGVNYCENLCDMRANITSYTHLDFDINSWDAWNLQFPDDTARIVEGLAWEAQYSPVVRLDLARRLVKGLMAAHAPGTRASYYFRHRSAGKTFMILDDQQEDNEGRLTLSKWGDSVSGSVKVGFSALIDAQWQPVESFSRSDTPAYAGLPAIARKGGTPDNLNGAIQSSPYWNESPFVFNRQYSSGGDAVDFTGRYWFSDENMPIEYTFESSDADFMDVVLGEEGEPMPMMGDGSAPGFIHLPDRQTVYRSDQQGDITLNAPGFNYLILRKETAWACPGYSTALLVMWEGSPDSVTAYAENGYGRIHLRYPKLGGAASGRVWLYPFSWVDDDDMAYIYRNAESFLQTGKMMLNGFPSVDFVNAVPTGLAAGAWLLAKYNDPAAFAARVQAENAVDAVLFPEDEGKWFIRSFYEVKAAAWMVKLGQLMNDQAMIDKYTPWVERIMARMLSGTLGYDGTAWPGGWAHFNSMKAVWLAWEATGRQDYLDAYIRALTVYTIDAAGIYRYGTAMDAPGGFNTYFGTLPMAEWGASGDWGSVDQLINLDVPSGVSTLLVSELWNDAGAGPWAQDDANPDFIGYCLRGLALPLEQQDLVPVGSGVMYDADGSVSFHGGSIVENPFFLEGTNSSITLNQGEKLPDSTYQIICKPGTENERNYMVSESGIGTNGTRVIQAGDGPVIYGFPLQDGTDDVALDMTLSGDAYQVAVSPNGTHWYQRLDSWSAVPERRALDVSFLAGNPDEQIRIKEVDPANDAAVIESESQTRLERGHCRYIDAGGSFVYRLVFPEIIQARAELVVGNGYRVEISADGSQWQEALRADSFPVRKGIHVADAAWTRMVDLTPALNGSDGVVYIRFSDLGQPSTFGGEQAFLRRVTVYGVFKSNRIYVRLDNVGRAGAAPLEIEELSVRTGFSLVTGVSTAQGSPNDLFQGTNVTITANYPPHPLGFDIRDLFTAGSPFYEESMVFADTAGNNQYYVDFHTQKPVDLGKFSIGLANGYRESPTNDIRSVTGIKIYASSSSDALMDNPVADVSVSPEYTEAYGSQYISINVPVVARDVQYFRVEFAGSTLSGPNGSHVLEIDGFGPEIAKIIRVAPITGGLMEIEINTPNPVASYLNATTDLVADSWTNAPHSDDGVNPFVVSNLTYSTTSGANKLIYVRTDKSVEFFRIGPKKEVNHEN